MDLTKYKDQTLTIRLYDLILLPDHHEAGNSYWLH